MKKFNDFVNESDQLNEGLDKRYVEIKIRGMKSSLDDVIRFLFKKEDSQEAIDNLEYVMKQCKELSDKIDNEAGF